MSKGLSNLDQQRKRERELYAHMAPIKNGKKKDEEKKRSRKMRQIELRKSTEQVLSPKMKKWPKNSLISKSDVEFSNCSCHYYINSFISPKEYRNSKI
jgi:hypothetical protein